MHTNSNKIWDFVFTPTFNGVKKVIKIQASTRNIMISEFKALVLRHQNGPLCIGTYNLRRRTDGLILLTA